MKGLQINKKTYPLEKLLQETGNLALLARQDHLEIMLQEIDEGMGFYLYPAEDNTTMEFFYIIDGEIEYDLNGDKQILGRNDYFTARGLEDSFIFKVKKTLTLLWITNEPLFHQISKEIQQLIDICARVEKKDRYTWNHSRRVQNLSMKIGRKIGMNKSKLHNLFLAAGLHDIGKINIPEEILNKPSKLTDEEFDIIKKHTIDGAEMVRATYYEDISSIIEQHHERVNGSGYPFGLKGDQTKIEAKIIAVADSFDAMTDDRAYRTAFSKEYAINEIKEMAGQLYDPDVVKAFEQVMMEENMLDNEVIE
ncbi:HD domain-containing phosphohydrolase [Bacillus spongiae]|uniref:HD domain-containing phosphohydrolase n=1 Tax=Bacillus spongiae TaxID=2683610 RepID=A0ABU8HG76_9BACI